MFNLMKYKYVFFGISLLVILPGLFSLAKFGLQQSIDFSGGTMIVTSNNKVIRTKGITLDQAKKAYPGIEITSFETVGPVVGNELKVNSLKAVAIATLAIIIYIAYAFREIAHPYSPWKWGVSAVIALLHDVLVVVGIFSILGHFYHVEIDALFVTAILTVIGFSVHDTIVVFDRIRENLRKTGGKEPFEQVVNDAILQTLARSLTTSLTVLFTLLALVLFGGESIRWFVVALLIGIFSGTYSSIFNAAPLLVIWETPRHSGAKR